MSAANKAVPETEVVIGGKSYRFVFGFRAMIELEKLGKSGELSETLVKSLNPANADASQLERISVILWAGLMKHHRGAFATVDDLIDAVLPSEFVGLANSIAKAEGRATPDSKSKKGARSSKKAKRPTAK